MKLFMLMMILTTNAFNLEPKIPQKFPKPSYTKIYDISYRRPLYIRKNKRPFVFSLIKDIHNIISNSIDEVYAMASLPLAHTNLYNISNISRSLHI